jgi:hypothetical protein
VSLEPRAGFDDKWAGNRALFRAKETIIPRDKTFEFSILLDGCALLHWLERENHRLTNPHGALLDCFVVPLTSQASSQRKVAGSISMERLTLHVSPVKRTRIAYFQSFPHEILRIQRGTHRRVEQNSKCC